VTASQGSARADAMEFYQLLSFKDDVDLEANLAEWERFYNLVRPHGAHRGKTPYMKCVIHGDRFNLARRRSRL
jgi:hypothetical protein